MAQGMTAAEQTYRFVETCFNRLTHLKLTASTMRQNLTFLVLMGIAVAIVVLFIFPFLRDRGHWGVVIPIAIFFTLLIVYGRHNPRPRPKL
jgi:uncharacterized membrane protein